MFTQEKEYKYITSYLKAVDFHFLDTWVYQCVNYCKSANPNISVEELKNTVKQQWLLLNLRDIKVPAFPPNLETCEKTVLKGRYAVQIESMVDCSKSYYSQLLNLRKINKEIIEDTQEVKEVNSKSDRCLIFTISDGVQELKAMEYKIIKKIKINDSNLNPGFKMVIIGPVECRKGMILLKDENVRLCGGEIDTLINTNNLQSLLMQKLGINNEDISGNNFEEQSNSQNILNKTQSSNQNILNTTQSSKQNILNMTQSSNQNILNISQSSNQNILNKTQFSTFNSSENENLAELLSQNDDIFYNLPSDYEALNVEKTIGVSNGLNKSNFNFEKNSVFDVLKESDKINNGIKTLKKRELPLEEKFSPNSKKLSCHSKKESFIFENKTIQSIQKTNNVKDMSVDEDVMVISSFSHHLKRESISEIVKKPVQTKLHSFFKKDEIINKKSTKLIMVDLKPFVYLKDIKAFTLKAATVFKIKCVVLTLKNKITIKNDKFNLKGMITDGSGSVDANFCSTIIENFLDYSPCEMEAMMKIKLTNNAVHGQIKEAFARAQGKFINLNCLMNVKFFPDETTPLILSLEEVTLEHLNALKKRTLHSY